MITQQEIIAAAHANGFGDIGFTTAEPFEAQHQYLSEHQDEYGWAENLGLALLKGTDPKSILPDAKSIIVLMEVYFQEKFPAAMECHFGRCYLDDDRVTKEGLSQRIKSFRNVLRDNGIDSKVPFHLPHRVAAARAGMGTFGKNCLFYSNRAAHKGSWVLPIAVVVNHEFKTGTPTVEMGCPDWCRNACIAACPTRALKGNGRIDPRKCISFLSYYGTGITPLELREPMGLYVYGCDRCQNVCPRNAPWLAKERPLNDNVHAKAEHFELKKLLHMDETYFNEKIWPHMFYMSYKDIWRWRMNVSRAMGNSLDPMYVGDLVKAYDENDDDRVKAMIVWALGKISGPAATSALERFLPQSTEPVKSEIQMALSHAGT